MTRDDIQKEAIALALSKNKIIFEWATGLGKSLIAIKTIEKINEPWNIVLAETTHELNWINEFKKHGKADLLKRVKFFCYPSLKNNMDDKNYIFDEVHHVTSEYRLNILSEINKRNLTRFIGLSATLTYTQKENIKNAIGNFEIHKVSLNTAIKNKLLPELKITLIELTLDNTDKYLSFGKNNYKYTEDEYYRIISNLIESKKLKYFNSGLERDKISWLSTASKRKKFIFNCKTKHAFKLINKLNQYRFICFTGDIEQSELLSSDNSIHSKKSKAQVNKLINEFNEGKINSLFTTKMLREGVNLKNLELGIIIQLDNVERMFVQVSGRTLRYMFPRVFIMYFKNTQDEVYVKNVLRNISNDIIEVKTLDDVIDL